MQKAIKIISPAIIFEVVSQFIAIITIPLILINLSLNEFAIYSTCLFFITLLNFCSQWGLVPKAIEIFKDKKNTIQNSSLIFLCQIYLAFFFLVIFLILGYVFKNFSNLPLENNLIISVTICFVTMVINPSVLIQALEKMHLLLFVYLTARVTYLIIIIFYIDILTINWLFNLIAIQNFIYLLAGYFLIIRLKVIKFSKNKFFFIQPFLIIRDSSKTFIISLANNHWLLILAVFANFYWTSIQIALFNALIQFFRPGANILEIFFRLMRQAYNSKSLKLNFSILILIILILTQTILLIFGERIYFIIFSNSFISSDWNYVQIIIFLLILNTIFKFFSYFYIPLKISFEESQKITLSFLGILLFSFPLIIIFSDNLTLFLISISFLYTIFIILIILKSLKIR